MLNNKYIFLSYTFSKTYSKLAFKCQHESSVHTSRYLSWRNLYFILWIHQIFLITCFEVKNESTTTENISEFQIINVQNACIMWTQFFWTFLFFLEETFNIWRFLINKIRFIPHSCYLFSTNLSTIVLRVNETFWL